MEIEIFFDDLSTDKQKEILEAAGIESASEMNWDVIPITTVEFEEFE